MDSTKLMVFSLTAAGLSDVGRVRSRNEDVFGIHIDDGLVVVADGMGGHPAGGDASALAVETFIQHVLGPRTHIARSPRAWGARMGRGVAKAHRSVIEAAAGDPAREGMGTTLTALRVDPADGTATLAHVGDSRLYRLRDQALTLLSRDHTWVQEQVDLGLIDPAGAHTHPMGHILSRVLGGSSSDARPLVRRGHAQAGDLYLLCTDGLNKHLADDDIAELLGAGVHADPLGKLAARLIEETNERGGTDNVTVVLLRVTAA